jgi:hypothetical protein
VIALTVRCGCGATGQARYGAPWRCASCGTRWQTAGGQDQDYRDFRTELRKIRLLVAGGLVIVAACAVLTAIEGTRVLLSGLIALALYYIVVLPMYRRRLRALYANLPQWRLSRTDP